MFCYWTYLRICFGGFFFWHCRLHSEWTRLDCFFVDYGLLRWGHGCANCGRACHIDNNDSRCAYYSRARGDTTAVRRGVVAWTPSQQDHMDTLAGTNGAIAHRMQISVRYTDSRRHFLMVDDVQYRVGRGSGADNNCLIDSLRQCLNNLECDPDYVRRELLHKFGHLQPDDPAYVGPINFLDAEAHWLDVNSCDPFLLIA